MEYVPPVFRFFLCRPMCEMLKICDGLFETSADNLCRSFAFPLTILLMHGLTKLSVLFGRKNIRIHLKREHWEQHFVPQKPLLSSTHLASFEIHLGKFSSVRVGDSHTITDKNFTTLWSVPKGNHWLEAIPYVAGSTANKRVFFDWINLMYMPVNRAHSPSMWDISSCF